MKRNVFKKISMAEKRSLFKDGLERKMIFHAKGESDELLTFVLAGFENEKILTLHYAQGSGRFQGPQEAIFNFLSGEDRFFFQAQVDVYQQHVKIPVDIDMYILQRRKFPRVDLPAEFPAGFNIIQYDNRPCLYECKVVDFSAGGCKVQYLAHLPLFKTGDQVRGVLHLSHRRPLELDCEVRYHVFEKATQQQVFGIQFKLDTSILENKLLVTFMELQRELLIKWS